MENKPVLKNDVKTLLQSDRAKEQFNQILGKNSGAFIASVIQLSNKPELIKCEPKSIISAAIISASLNLSCDPSLGQAAIVPFKTKQADGSYIDVAQFQIMYKGLIQLALRSGQVQTINSIEVHEGDILKNNILTGEIIFTENQNFDKPVVGYAAYIRLINGFEKMIYVQKTEIEKHAKKYSKTFNSNYSVWKTDFDKMAQKTLLKMLLSKYAPLSIEMQQAIKFDGATVKQNENFDLSTSEIVENDFIEETPAILDNPTAKKVIENENNQ